MTPAEIHRIAELAGLALDDDAVERLAPQFAALVEAMRRVGDVDTTGVEPLRHPLPVTDVLRDDRPAPGLAREAFLAGAPDVDGGFVRVRWERRGSET